MKRNYLRVITACVTAMMSVSLLSGCKSASVGKQNEIQKTSEPVKISIIQADPGRVWKDDNPVTKEIEKQTNTKIEMTFVPSADYTNKYNVMAASGNIPDISCLGAFSYQSYADQGLFMDVSTLVDKYGSNLKKNIGQKEWDYGKYKGKQFAIPYVNDAGKTVPVIRQDWLDNLGLKAPSNLDEFEDVLKKFTFNDPDKNGKNDTYGMGSVDNGVGSSFDMIYGAYGIIPSQAYLKDNKIYPAIISQEYKLALQYLNKLWSDKVIDPDIFIIKLDQARQKTAQGKIGYFGGWWSIVPEVLTNQLKMPEIVPGSKLSPLPAIKGPEGKSGMSSNGSMGGSRCISAKAANPEAVIKFMDFLIGDEGYELSYWGIKGTHYTDPLQGRSAEGQKAFEEKWLDPLSQISNRADLQKKWRDGSTSAPIKANAVYTNAAMSNNLLIDILYGTPTTDEQKTLSPDLTKFEEDMRIRFITGLENFSKWDEYVKNWKEKGGDKILDSRIKAYNQINSKNYTSGIK